MSSINAADSDAVPGSNNDCLLSKELEKAVLDNPGLKSEQAIEGSWGAVALATMAAILRTHGYVVKEPFCRSSDVGRSIAYTTSVEDTPMTGIHETIPSDVFARFENLTTTMDQNIGEDGRVPAEVLEKALLAGDGRAFEKEGVSHLKHYLMKARKSGIPVKFHGDHNRLSQVWFKGHKDLGSAIARYSASGATAPGSSVSVTLRRSKSSEHETNWHRPLHRQRQPPLASRHHRTPTASEVLPAATTALASARPANRYRTPSERAFDVEFLLDILHASGGADDQQGANAAHVEQRLLNTFQSLYQIKAGVKHFNHYLMNMRAAGAPIW
ncbi:hypothetical protein CBS101457_002164 [Exobasidium rhododendri]|nr:hypothetical protein CBS101457_002164 [Exobasidium rhododendri]